MSRSVFPDSGLVVVRHTRKDAKSTFTAAGRLGDLLAQASAAAYGKLLTKSLRPAAIVAQDERGTTTAIMTVGISKKDPGAAPRVLPLTDDAPAIVDAWADMEDAIPLAEAEALFGDLHGDQEPDNVRPVQLSLPDVVTELGHMEAVEYQADRGDGLHSYRHEFEDPLPTLAVDPESRRLIIVEGGYTVTPRGIEG